VQAMMSQRLDGCDVYEISHVSNATAAAGSVRAVVLRVPVPSPLRARADAARPTRGRVGAPGRAVSQRGCRVSRLRSRRLPGIEGVEVRHAVLRVVHRDDDSVEAADPRHSTIFRVLPDDTQRGLRGVYVFAVPGLRPPPRRGRSLGFMRPRATRRNWRRHLINARMKGSAVRIRASALSICRAFLPKPLPRGDVPAPDREGRRRRLHRRGRGPDAAARHAGGRRDRERAPVRVVDAPATAVRVA
jgi:hypothetical protein